jgi:hypothetical protein
VAYPHALQAGQAGSPDAAAKAGCVPRGTHCRGNVIAP